MNISDIRSMSLEDVESIATKLCEAIQQEDTSVIKELLLRRIPAEALYTQVSSLRGLRHHTALHYAVEEDGGSRAGMLKMLLRSFPNELQAHIDELGQGQVERRHYGENQEYRTFLEFEEYTPLCWAALHANVEAVKSLLAAGANVDSQESHDRSTALITVCSRSTTESRDREYRVITLLRKSGAKIGLQDSKGCTALHYLLSRGYHDFFRMLLPRIDSPLTASNIHGWTLLHCAAFYSRGQDTGELVHSIINKGVDVGFYNKQGLTAMELAKRSENARVVKILKPYKVFGTDSNSTARINNNHVKATPSTSPSHTPKIDRAHDENSSALEIGNVDQNLHPTSGIRLEEPPRGTDSRTGVRGQEDQRILQESRFLNLKPGLLPNLNDPWQAFYQFSMQKYSLENTPSLIDNITMKLEQSESGHCSEFYMGPLSKASRTSIKARNNELEDNGIIEIYHRRYRTAVTSFTECLSLLRRRKEEEFKFAVIGVEEEFQFFRVSIHLACALSHLGEVARAHCILKDLDLPWQYEHKDEVRRYVRPLAEYFLVCHELPAAKTSFEYLVRICKISDWPLHKSEACLGLELSIDESRVERVDPSGPLQDSPQYLRGNPKLYRPKKILILFLLIGIGFWKRSDFNSALALFEEAADFATKHTDIMSYIRNLPWVYMAKTKAVLSDYEGAIKICKNEFQRLHKENDHYKSLFQPVYLELEAECCFKLQKYGESIRVYSLALSHVHFQPTCGTQIEIIDREFGRHTTASTAERIKPDVDRINYNLELIERKLTE